MKAQVKSKAHIVKPNFFVTISLLICMVFATSASAFLHLHEHNLELSHADLTHVEKHADAHHDHDVSAEHAHHFNLHITADLVEHDAISIIKSANLISGDVITPLVSRSYTPPIPPPNA